MLQHQNSGKPISINMIQVRYIQSNAEPPYKIYLDFKNSEAGDLADKSRYVSPTELADIYCDFIKNYPIVSIEDPFDQDDWEGKGFTYRSVVIHSELI